MLFYHYKNDIFVAFYVLQKEYIFFWTAININIDNFYNIEAIINILS